MASALRGVQEDEGALLSKLRRPVPTAALRGARYVAGVDWQGLPARARARRQRAARGETSPTLPGLSQGFLDALRRKYAPATASHPRVHRATFQAPLDLSEDAFAALRLARVKAFVEALQRQGYRLCTDRPIRLTAGPYPAYDLRDGLPRLDRREYHIAAHFTYPDPQPVRLELPPWATEPVPVPA